MFYNLEMDVKRANLNTISLLMFEFIFDVNSILCSKNF